MHHSAIAPSRWVQLLQALVARELVEQMGVPVRRAALLLGLAPSAVSQYVRGKRHATSLVELAAHPEVTTMARQIAKALSSTPADRTPSHRQLFQAAGILSEIVSGGHRPTADSNRSRQIDRTTPGELRARIAAEQAAVTECMELAQRARDEPTRAIFRQIASDSLRHAEIVASLAAYTDAGVRRIQASGITRSDIRGLIAREREAEQGSSKELRHRFGGVLGLLAESMAADERKHGALLQGLLRRGILST